MCTPELGALEDLPPQEEREEDGDIDVRDEEISRLPAEEDFVAIDQDEDDAPEQTPYGEIGLETAVVSTLCAVEALCTLSAVWKKLSAKM